MNTRDWATPSDRIIFRIEYMAADVFQQGVWGRQKKYFSKFLYFCNATKLQQSDLLETTNYLEYITKLDSLNIWHDGIK